MITKELELKNKLGLHLRAASKLSDVASSFKSFILLSNDNGQKIDAKSVLGITLLAAAYGSKIVVSAEGSDEKEAMISIEDLFDKKFGEEV
jgi:phosphocarrier protein